jgi:hypothetical protein
MTDKPTIIIPYPGPSLSADVQDIFIYLRPESNGVLVEGPLLKSIHDYPAPKDSLKIIYMANIPGSFLIKHRIIEEHYSLKVRFAVHGKDLFTAAMRRAFEDYFQIPFNEADIIGSFEALKRLNYTYEELFRLWLPEKDLFTIYGQTVKRFKGIFIVNYDIPALLHKNNNRTNIFVIILRSFLPYSENHKIMDLTGKTFSEQGLLAEHMPLSYVLHYSKGPFEQILDGLGYAYTREEKHAALPSLSFFAYLLDKGCVKEDILEAIHNPIMNFSTESGIVEKNLLLFTAEKSFKEAYQLFESRI